MKKIITFLLCLILSLSTLPLFAFADDQYFSQEQIDYYKNLGLQGTTVNVYNWGEYISDGGEGSIDVVKEFEKLTVLINRINRNIRKMKSRKITEYDLRGVHISCLQYLYKHDGAIASKNESDW